MSTVQNAVTQPAGSTTSTPTVPPGGEASDESQEMVLEYSLLAAPEHLTLLRTNNHYLHYTLSAPLQSRISYGDFSASVVSSMRTREKKQIFLPRHVTLASDFNKAYRQALTSQGIPLKTVKVKSRRPPDTKEDWREFDKLVAQARASGGEIMLDLEWWVPEESA